MIRNLIINLVYLVRHRLNKKLVRKPYPLPRIGEAMHQLEVFHYTSTLYLNMRYYNINILPTSQNMMTIVTDFGKFRYNSVPMGICALCDIFQEKVDKLLGNIEGVKTYIDDIIVLSKESFSNNIEQLRTIYFRLRA